MRRTSRNGRRELYYGYSRYNDFDWHMFLMILLPVIIVVVSVVNSLFLIIYYNIQPSADELDPSTQYNITYLEDSDAGVNILVESLCEHPIQIKLLIEGYRPESSLYDAGEYSTTRTISLKSGQSQTLYADRYTVYTGAIVEEVIVEPKPTIYVDLTWLAIMTFVILSFEWFVLGSYVNEVRIMDPRASMPFNVLVTAIWMVLVVWVTEWLIRHDVVFYILGINISFS